MAMTLVSTITVGSGGASNIDFTNIPQTGKDLLILFSLRTNRSSLDPDVQNFYFNNNGASYSVRRLRGRGSDVASSNPSYLNPFASDTNDTSNTFSNGSIYVSNYTSSAAKSTSSDMVTENNSSEAWQAIYGMSWNNSSAVTEVNVAGAGGTFQQYSSVSLYIIS